MPFDATGLTSLLADFKVYRNIASADTTYDTEIKAKFTSIVSFAERYCGKTFGATSAATRTDYLNGNDTDTVVVTYIPIAALTSVSLLDNAGTATVLESTTYRTDLNTGVIRLIGAQEGVTTFDNQAAVPFVAPIPSFPRGYRNVKVIYTYGAASYAAIPDDFKFALFRATDRIRASVGIRDSLDKDKRVGDDVAFIQECFRPFRSAALA